LALAAGAAAMLSGPAWASPIVGSISFSDGFTSLSTSGTAIVSDLVNIDVAASTLAQACTGVLATGGACIPSTGTFASSFILADPIATQIVYTYNGFVFTVNALAGPISRGSFTCAAGSCSDSLGFTGTGIITGGGFDPTPFSMVWTAQGTCTAAAGAALCAAQTSSGFWNARVTALPEPATLALLAVATLLLALSRRRRTLA
jgi:hypothetical protein